MHLLEHNRGLPGDTAMRLFCEIAVWLFTLSKGEVIICMSPVVAAKSAIAFMVIYIHVWFKRFWYDQLVLVRIYPA